MAAAKPAAKKRKALKIPKGFGACADLLHDTRDERLALQKEAKEIEGDEKAIKDHLIQKLQKGDEGGAVGKRYKAISYNDPMFVVDDWDKFYAHIKKTGEFDLLNRALNQAAVKERVADQVPPKSEAARAKWKPKLPPGVASMNVVKLSLTKV